MLLQVLWVPESRIHMHACAKFKLFLETYDCVAYLALVASSLVGFSEHPDVGVNAQASSRVLGTTSDAYRSNDAVIELLDWNTALRNITASVIDA